MERLTNKKSLENFNQMIEKFKDYIPSNTELIYNKLGKLEDIEEELGISISDFYKICKAKYIWGEIGIAFTNILDDFVLFDIKGFDVEQNIILLKENKYDLRSIPFNMYKICFWLNRDKSE